MSNHFYKYLARKIGLYFSKTVLRSGDKYHIQFEREEQVEELMQAIVSLPTVGKFRYTTHGGSLYETPCLEMNNLQVLVASTLNGTTPDFLTTLRNRVGTDETEFQKTAILLIHNSTLDSLIHGMNSFAKEGMPFHLEEIESDLKHLLLSSPLTKTEQKVLEFVMGIKREDQTYQEQITLFDFEDIIKVLDQAKILPDNYVQFGIFYDEGLDDHVNSQKNFLQRLKENYKLFEQVETIHKSGVPEQDLEKLFDQSGAKRLSQENWKEASFVEIHKSYVKKQEDKGLDYIESNKKVTIENVYFWERSDSDTKAGQRTRHILLFNVEKKEHLTLEFGFSDSLYKQYIDIKPKNDNITGEVGVRKLRLHLKHQLGQTNFYRAIYKTETSNKFEFLIASVECDPNWLKAFQTEYKVHVRAKSSYVLIFSEATEWFLHEDGTELSKDEIVGGDDPTRILVNDDAQLLLSKNVSEDNEEEHVRFDLVFPQTSIPFALRDVVERPQPVTGLYIWKWKREKQEHCTYRMEPENKMKILLNTRESYTQGEFRRHLDRERHIVESGGMFFIEKSGFELELVELEIPKTIKVAYANLIRYFQVNKLLPSLAYMDSEYRELASAYVNAFLSELNELSAGQSLDEYQRNLGMVGTIEKDYGDREWLFTPLHPLNLAYQLQVNTLLHVQTLGDELLRTLRPTHLVPYVNYSPKAVYKPIEQTDAYEWTVYVNHELPRYEGARSFGKKLVQEKIDEFTGHFAYLFDMDRQAPLKINLVNMGSCREVLQGIFEYYRGQLKEKVSKHDLLPIEIHIYSEAGVGNAFEEFAQFSTTEEISRLFELKLQVDDFLPEELLNIFREKVSFYSNDVQVEAYEYCHVAFYQMRKIEQTAAGNMSETVTGVSLFGLLSGVPSVFINGDYKTGFGTKYYLNEEVPLLQLVPKLNSLLLVARTLDNYQEDSSRVTAISLHRKKELDRVYDSSHWVTFVEPRIDLSFFKNDADQKDLLVIHYSDQYTSSSGFDAITVTRRSQQYQQLIMEFLQSHQIDVQEQMLPKIINFFNAMNGNWLLRLLAQENHFPKEKISILSAVKVSLAYFSHPNILWVPISMEEVLRVSGGTGLKQSEGLFSVKNLGSSGSYSDDLLLIGFELQDDELRVHLYPIEVKIGHNQVNVKDKAKVQVVQTRELLRKFLQEGEDGFQSKYYRNFFMQMAIMSAEKMKLYEVWPEQDWSVLTNSELRSRLLNDDYVVVDELTSQMGEGAIISFTKDVLFSSARMENQVLVIDYPERSGFEFIVRDLELLKRQIQSGNSDILKSGLLSVTYKPSLTEAESESTVARDGDIVLDMNADSVVEEAKAEAVKEQSTQSEPLSILFGHNATTEQEVRWFPTTTSQVMHTNTGIIGTMGTGKTQFTKSLITQLHLNSRNNVNGSPIGILIFDYKGDYVKPEFVEATGATIYKLHHLPFNPLSLYLTDPPQPMLPKITGNALAETIVTAFNLGNVQTLTLKELITDAYAAKGIIKNDPSTWELPAPTFQDLYNLHASQDGVKKDSLYAALNELTDMEIFEPESSKTRALFEMIDGITVIDLTRFDESIQNLVVAITLDVFYNQMQMVGHSRQVGDYREITRMILVDEADNFLSKDFKSIKKILKEGREYGVGTILSTQFLSHFASGDIDYSAYIRTWIIHSVSEINSKDIRSIFNTQSKSEEEQIMNRIRTLQKHYSVVKGIGDQTILMRDKAFWELMCKS